MIRGEVIKTWGDLKATLTEIKRLVIEEELFSTQAEFSSGSTRLVWIKDPQNQLKKINLTELPSLEELRLTYAPEKEPALTSLTIKDCSNSGGWWRKRDFSVLWTKTKYFSKVKLLELHYLPEECFPKKIIDFSAYSALERLTVEIAYGSEDYEKIILKAPNLKILNWKGGRHLEQLESLEQCSRLEIVKFKDITVSKELGEKLKNHPRYKWACQSLGEDSWEWVVKKDESNLPPDEESGPTIEEVD